MDIETLMHNNLPKISPAGGVGQGGMSKPGVDSAREAADFRNALDTAVKAPATKSIGPQGLAALTQPGPQGPVSSLKFSSHAVERMRSRGISYQPDMMKNIEGAVQKAAAKGSKDALILTGDSALIVSVKNNTVVTVMDRASMKENVFTNIDSTVVL